MTKNDAKMGARQRQAQKMLAPQFSSSGGKEKSSKCRLLEGFQEAGLDEENYINNKVL